MNQSIVSQKKFAAAAIPFIFSNMTQPLLGAVDVAVVGRLMDSSYISGVSVGVTIFNTIYWIFGFLRVSTTGFIAQAMGRKSREDEIKAVLRPLVIALAVGVSIVLIQSPLWNMCKDFLCSDTKVAAQARIYYSVLIWAVPLVFINYVCLGYIMGIGLLKQAVILQSIGNVVNVALDLLFVNCLGMQVMGVAAATLISQIITAVLGIYLVLRHGRFTWDDRKTEGIWNKTEVRNMLLVNMDMMIRTTCLVFVSNLFVKYGGQFGTDVLAANSVMGQIIDFMTYAYEGLGNAASTFSGRAWGEKNPAFMREVVAKTLQWSGVLIILSVAVFHVFKNQIIGLFTDIPSVLIEVNKYVEMVYLFPFAACLGFSIYGIFSGATMPRPGRNALIIATVIFIVLAKVWMPFYGNGGLWAARISYFAGRTIFIFPYMNRLKIEKGTV